MENINENSRTNARQERFISHALVEVRKFRWLPFGIHSAVLLDLSLMGFKIEFTGEFVARVQGKYWLNIPLAPLGIHSPARIICQTQAKWFDQRKYRMGGVFTHLDRPQRIIINQIVETLKDKGVSGL